MTADSIIQDIKKGNISPIYFLNGDEPYFIDLISDYIQKNVLTEAEQAFNLVVLYGKELEFKQVVDEARQYPMMSSRRVIIIKEAQSMSDLTELAGYIDQPLSSSVLVMCYKHKTLDKRTKFAKLLSEKAIVFTAKKLYDSQLSPWVDQYIKSLGYQTDRGVCEILSEYIGADLSKMTNEIQKLIINIPTSKSITVDHVREHIGINKDFDVFEFQKALGSKNYSKSFRIMQYLAQNSKANPPVVVIASVFSYFNKIMIAQSRKGVSDQDLAKLLGVNAFFVKEYISAAKNFSTQEMFAIFEMLKRTDKWSKGVQTRGMSEASILKELLYTVFSRATKKIKS
ncbi:MAG: DNA polymerase III subunit delta [Saprospiraceae bacterium]